jgi:hypothetical protein
MREGGFRAAFLFVTAAPGEWDAPRGHRVASEDVRDLTHRKKDRDVRYEILRHSGDAGTSLSVTGAGQRIARQSTPNDFGGPWRMCAMLEQDAGRKASRKFAGSSAIETGLSQINDPKEGARLIQAFLRITDPAIRLAMIHMVEKVGSAAAADC